MQNNSIKCEKCVGLIPDGLDACYVCDDYVSISCDNHVLFCSFRDKFDSYLIPFVDFIPLHQEKWYMTRYGGRIFVFKMTEFTTISEAYMVDDPMCCFHDMDIEFIECAL